MKYGFCTGFATTPAFSFNQQLIDEILQCGYDYAELPLYAVEALPDDDFSLLASQFKSPVSCNLLPGSLNIYTTDKKKLSEYFKKALSRAKAIGNRYVIFGSGAARSYPSSLRKTEAFEKLVIVVKEVIIPAAEDNGIIILAEPLRRGECNIINTIKDGHDLVLAVNDESFSLMADLYHMNENGEKLDELEEFFYSLHHIHIAEKNRQLPVKEFSHFIVEALKKLKKLGYSGTISFETSDGDKKKALNLLRKYI